MQPQAGEACETKTDERKYVGGAKEKASETMTWGKSG